MIYVMILCAADDATPARTTKFMVKKVLDDAIDDEVPGQGFSAVVRSYNKEADLVLECEIVFP